MSVADQLCEQAKLLSEALAREALDFVLFLRDHQERLVARHLIAAQTASLAAIRDNVDDEAWSNV